MPKYRFSILIRFVLMVAALSGTGEGAEASPKVTRATSQIRVDGVLDERAWQDATVIPVPWEWSPGTNLPAPVETRTLVTFDERTLYVAFEAHDPRPEEIRAHFFDRDSGSTDDTVSFLIDTFDDDRRAYQFRSNPLGVQTDVLISDVDGSEDESWNAIWSSAGRITSFGYIVEIAVPFSQLQFPVEAGEQSWGFLAMRHYPRTSRHRLRSVRIDRSRNCFVCQFGDVTGFESIRQGNRLELTPSVTALTSETLDRFPDGELGREREQVEAGITGKWSPSSAMVVNVAVNPDFSHVEADSLRLDVNERFALSFPERRAFFMEGADLFRTPFSLVFTRTIADPAAGVRVTGKQGPHAYGALLALDEINNLIIPGYQSSDDTTSTNDVWNAIGRYRRDIGGRSSLGILYTGREADAYGNHVLSLDGRFQLAESDTVLLQMAASSTEYPIDLAFEFDQSDEPFEGHALRGEYSHQDRNWFWFAALGEVTDSFRADTGFMPRVGRRFGGGGLERTFRTDGDDWYDELSVSLGVDFTHALEGEAREWTSSLSVAYEGPWQSEIEVALLPRREYFDGIHYDQLRYALEISMRPVAGASFGLEAATGETIDFRHSRPADFVTIEGQVEVHLGRNLRGGIGHSWQELQVEGERLFSVHQTESRLVYHFNRKAFLRAVLQYEQLERNPRQYRASIAELSEDFFGQFLFSYELRPRTALLIGYGDSRYGEEQIDLTLTDRSFFAKLQYAFLF